MAGRPMILVPPSEAKTPGGTGAPWSPGTGPFADLDASRRRVVAALARAMRANRAERERLLGVKGDALAAATTTNRAVREAPTAPALERYCGVLYGALDASTLPRRSRDRADAQLAIVSGLWGLVSPLDAIPDYKLKMGASLAGLGKLSTWWRPQLTAALAERTAGRVVWDLLPNEHAAAWDPDPASMSARITVRFFDRTNGPDGERLVAVSHWNKLLKGALVRHVLATQLDDPAGLARFDHPLGYRYEAGRTVADGDRVVVSMVREASAPHV